MLFLEVAIRHAAVQIRLYGDVGKTRHVSAAAVAHEYIQ